MAKLVSKALDRVSPPAVVRKQMAMGGSGSFTPFGSFSQLGYGSAAGDKGYEIDFDTLRMFRAAIPWAAAAMDSRRDLVMHARWKIGPADPQDDDYDEALAQEITDRLESPDPTGIDTSYATLVGRACDDTLTVGRGAMRPIRYKEAPGKNAGMDGLEKLRTIDGKRVKENPDWDPDADQDAVDNQGDLTNPRYYYLDPGKQTAGQWRGKPLKSDELVLIKPNPTSYQTDGLSPMIYLWSFLHAERDVFRSVHMVQKNRMPPGVLKVPNAQPGTIDKLTTMLKERVQGKAGVAVVDIPADADWMGMGELNLAAQGAFSFYDIVVRGVAAAFRCTTVQLGWTFDANRTTADVQGEFNDEGGLNLLRLFQSAFNTEVLTHWEGGEKLRFRYLDLPVEDEAEGVDAVNAWGGGIFIVATPDELRTKAGLEPIERKKDSLLDRAYKDMWVKSGSSAVPLFMALGLAPNLMPPGYDPETGEIDKEAAAKEAAANAPPGLGTFAADAVTGGKLPANGKPGALPAGQRQLPAPAASDNGAKVPAPGTQTPVASQKENGHNGRSQADDALAAELEELDAIFRGKLTEARRARERVRTSTADDGYVGARAGH